MTRDDSGKDKRPSRIRVFRLDSAGTSHLARDTASAELKRTIFITTLCIYAALVWPNAAEANPEGGQLVTGSASIRQTTPTRLDVHQTTDKAILDWRGFSIDPDEHTNFQQPSSNAVTLNRVSGANPSNIKGRMTANGRVFLVNPSGVVFGQGARVDVGGLVATTADIGNEDFIEGRYVFDKASSNPNASVVNHGQITVDESGMAVLAAPAVRNEGLIQARLGRVALAGTNTFTLDFDGDGLLQFGVGGEVKEQPKDPDGQALDTLVANTGKIVADGGQVVLSANVKDAVVDRVINMEGVVQAHAVDTEGGTIILSGGDTGVVAVSGMLDVSGTGQGQKGGTAKVLGSKVGLFDGVRVKASGDTEGGEVIIGGNFQGKGPEPNARRTYVAPGAVIEADAKGAGDGGRVIVWADEITGHQGAISAQGGPFGGDGGFVEVSGKRFLDFKGTVLVDAPEGQSGTLLLDPQDIVITEGPGAQDDQIQLIEGANESTGTQISAEGVLFGDGGLVSDFTLGAESLEALEGNIVLQADRDITVDAPLDLEKQEAGEFVVLQAGRDININADVRTNGADLHLEADSPHAPGVVLGTTIRVAQNVEISTGIRDGIDESDLVPGKVLDITTGGDITLIAAGYEINPSAVIDAGRDSRQILLEDPFDPDAGAIRLRGGDINLGTTIGFLEIGSGIALLSPEELNTFQGAEELRIGGTSTAGSNGLAVGDIFVGNAQQLGMSLIEVMESVSIRGEKNIQMFSLEVDFVSDPDDSIFLQTSVEFDPSVNDPEDLIIDLTISSGLHLRSQNITIGPGSRVASNFGVSIETGFSIPGSAILDIEEGALIEAPLVTIDAGLFPLNLSPVSDAASFNIEPATLQSIKSNALILRSDDAMVADNIASSDLANIALLALGADTVTFGGGSSAFGRLLVNANSLILESTVTGRVLSSGSISVLEQLGPAFGSIQYVDLESSTIGDATFDTPLTIYAGLGNSLAINGTLTGSEGASITLSEGISFLDLLPEKSQQVYAEFLTNFPATPTLSGDIITAGSPITLDVPIVLGADVDLVTTANGAAGSDITVAAVDADAAANNRALSMLAGNGTVTAGDLGSTQALGALSVNGAFINLNDVTTTGSQDFAGTTTFNSDYVTNGGAFTVTGPLLLASETTVTTNGGAILFDDTVDGNVALTLSAGTGDITFNDDVGSNQPLGALSVNGAFINLNDVTTTGLQDYAGATTFNSDYVTNGGAFTVTGPLLLASDTSVTTNGGTILFDGAVDGNNALTLSAETGDITFNGDVGLLDPLGPVTTLSAQDIAINRRFIASDTSFSYTGFLTTAPDSLEVSSLFLDPAAGGARVFGTIGGVPGFTAALSVDGPVGDPDFLINGCVIGVPCVFVLPPAAEPQSRPPISLSKVDGPEVFESALIFVARKGSEIPPDDPTTTQFSNFGNEELWMQYGKTVEKP